MADAFNDQNDMLIDQGATWQATVGWYNRVANSDPPVPDYTSPVDLSGFTARLDVRAYAGAPDPPLASITNVAGIVIDGPNGLLALTLSAAQTAALPAGVSVYELEVTSPGGVRTRLSAANAVVSAQVTP